MIRQIDNIYTQDAYNSLSIEGYVVTEKLIQKVAEGNFNPTESIEDNSGSVLWPPKGII